MGEQLEHLDGVATNRQPFPAFVEEDSEEGVLQHTGQVVVVKGLGKQVFLISLRLYMLCIVQELPKKGTGKKPDMPDEMLEAERCWIVLKKGDKEAETENRDKNWREKNVCG
ncbi:MAG: hypothetical protein JEY71_14405 [Sphaerochaeta sp.]|nr:hypothetical protein [Sphaerochaeta sp.]